MAFVLQDVINEIEETRSLEPLKKLKKENLIKVAAHYGITPAVGATKSHILNLIKDHCVEHDIIDEVEEKPIAGTHWTQIRPVNVTYLNLFLLVKFVFLN